MLNKTNFTNASGKIPDMSTDSVISGYALGFMLNKTNFTNASGKIRHIDRQGNLGSMIKTNFTKRQDKTC